MREKGYQLGNDEYVSHWSSTYRQTHIWSRLPPERKASAVDVVRNSYGTMLGSRRLLSGIGPTFISGFDNEYQGVINNEQAQSGFAPARFPADR